MNEDNKIALFSYQDPSSDRAGLFATMPLKDYKEWFLKNGNHSDKTIKDLLDSGFESLKVTNSSADFFDYLKFLKDEGKIFYTKKSQGGGWAEQTLNVFLENLGLEHESDFKKVILKETIENIRIMFQKIKDIPSTKDISGIIIETIDGYPVLSNLDMYQLKFNDYITDLVYPADYFIGSEEDYSIKIVLKFSLYAKKDKLLVDDRGYVQGTDGIYTSILKNDLLNAYQDVVNYYAISNLSETKKYG